ncbi:MAG TPA: chemotaxis protein CheB [Sphingobacteriaceae bacterium]|nr:chemotaxis protein CheB [Sphingobacteriaceae bacterium]
MDKLNSTPKQGKISRVIVIGTSAGGLNALKTLFSQFQKDFPLPVLVVQHISPDATGNVLLDTLNSFSNLTCQHAKKGEKLKPGYVYLAPSDHHLMIGSDLKILVTKGAQENRSRPAIDPLFRSAAVALGNGVIGILLTGYLDDGTAGMKVIKRCGGICIVQDPKDAEYPPMPLNAMTQVDVDYCVPLSEMGALIYQLIPQKLGKKIPVPKDILIEAKIAERVLSDLPSVNSLGKQIPFNCPGCGGVLWKMDKDTNLRFRCHTGHAYTSASLLAEQTKKIEETMWTALRMFEERKNLLTEMANGKSGVGSKSALERANMSQVHIDRIRLMLQTDTDNSGDDIPT